jgi:hypothetical protein
MIDLLQKTHLLRGSFSFFSCLPAGDRHGPTSIQEKEGATAVWRSFFQVRDLKPFWILEITAKSK